MLVTKQIIKGKNMRQINKIALYAVGIVIAILAALFIILPSLFIGPPLTHMFDIYNEDYIGHMVTIEIIDSNNKSVFENEYELSPKGTVKKYKGPWFLLKSFSPLENRHLLKATLENNRSVTYDTSLGPWETVIISIDSINYNENDGIAIYSLAV